MQAAFGALALSLAAVGLAAWPYTATRTGPLLLFVAAAGAVGAGIFVTDPLGTEPARQTRAGRLHNAMSLAVIPVFPLAVALTAWPASLHPVSGVASWLGVLVWIGFAGFFGSALLGAKPPMGLTQRFMVLTYASWLAAVGWTIAQTHWH